METRQRWVRETLWKLIGGMPVRNYNEGKANPNYQRCC
jgi:hypothetical protein